MYRIAGAMSLLRDPRLVTAASLLLGLALLGAGGAKLLRLDFEVEAFGKFGLPVWLMVQVGIVEVVAAALLARARTATLGAILGVAIMSVAAPAHAFSDELHLAPVPVLFLGGLVWVGWRRRAHLAHSLS